MEVLNLSQREYFGKRPQAAHSQREQAGGAKRHHGHRNGEPGRSRQVLRRLEGWRARQLVGRTRSRRSLDRTAVPEGQLRRPSS